MDISNLEVPNTAEVHIEFPGIGKLYADEEKKMPIIVEVYGPASNQAVEFKRKLSSEASIAFAKGGAKGLRKLTNGNDIAEREIERLVSMTASVKNMFYHGEPVTTHNIEKIYRDPKYGWLTEQVNEKIGSWESFLL